MHCGLPRVVESNAKAMSFPAHRGPLPSENSSSHLSGKQGSQEPAVSFLQWAPATSSNLRRDRALSTWLGCAQGHDKRPNDQTPGAPV
jgi:hypothetical protein